MSDPCNNIPELEDMITEVQSHIDAKEQEFHGYRGNIARLKDGRSGKILDGKGLKLFLQDVDGNVIECYHDELETIFSE